MKASGNNDKVHDLPPLTLFRASFLTASMTARPSAEIRHIQLLAARTLEHLSESPFRPLTAWVFANVLAVLTFVPSVVQMIGSGKMSASEMSIFRRPAMALSNYLFLIMSLGTLLAGSIHSVAAFNLVRMNSMFHFCRCRRMVVILSQEDEGHKVLNNLVDHVKTSIAELHKSAYLS
ncbi:hypothetical protein DFH08DRAFT_984205 [Mycena albidolilacea]|uniref:Uncharacterized protein n=1 Tax=Mycena albidolilacea TaxID=1033008 RepID=A0AAD7EY14_9AGAR|nr:hypothetical protein DFH08DRAFT_984205 [Mycena albidolilacea]